MVTAMHKYILPLALLFFSMNIYSQVIIKEKVEINPTTNSIKSNEPTLTENAITWQLDVEFSFTPYSYPFGNDLVGKIYGRVYMEKTNIPQPFILRENGHVEDGFATLSYTFLELPSSILYIGIGSSFATTLGHDPIQFNRGNANVQVQIYLDGVLQPESYTSSTYNQGYVILVLDGNCPNASGNFCDNSSWVQIPNVDLVPYNQSSFYGGIECDKKSNRLAIFTPVLYPPIDRTNLYHLTSADVLACYNRILKTWQFNLNQNVRINYVVEICSTNISNKNLTIISSINDINTIPSNKCTIALKSFEGHKFYPYRIDPGGYVIKEVLLLHENAHKDKYEKFKNDYLYIWETKIESFKNPCQAFPNISEAKEAALNMYKFVFSSYYTQFSSVHNQLLGLSPENDILKDREEQRVNNSKEIKEKIDKYIEELKKHCR